MPIHDLDCLSVARRRKTLCAVHAVRACERETWVALAGEPAVAFAESCGFTAQAGRLVLVPGTDGKVQALFGLPAKDTGRDPFIFGKLAQDLPEGDWTVHVPDDVVRDDVILGFCLGAYRYSLKAEGQPQGRPRLVVTAGERKGLAAQMARSICFARDLINTPANLLGPSELAREAKGALRPLGAEVEVIKGAALDEAYPLLAHVGNGSERGPRVVVARWSGTHAGKDAPLVSLVGKGVCFDSGGYDIKSSGGMLRMKKDMGGAATVLALAHLVMAQDLPVRLELRLGCVENSVSGHAMRPLDVIRSRAGLTVEIGNTDAEGRLVLSDLLYEAGESQPDLLVDVATLTGAARVALGPDLPALFCNNDSTAMLFAEAAEYEGDPLWRLPLWQGYAGWLKSPVADLNNIASRPMAGAITASLFLEHFVKPDQRWAHVDSYAWNDSSRPGRPEGGDTPGIRALFRVIRSLCGTNDTELT